MSNVELRQLRYFAAVAELLSFGKAAKALHISQPPLSRQVRSLERSVGVLLLNRSTSGVSLTPAGTVFLAEVQRILRKIQNAAELARRAEKGQLDSLTIGCSHYLDIVLGQFVANHQRGSTPALQLHFESLPSMEQVHLLRHFGLDAGIVRLPLPEMDHLSIDVLGREPIVAMVGQRHSLAARKQISLNDLSSSSVLVMRRQSGAEAKADQIERICEDAGLKFEAVESREPVVEMLDAVRNDFGVALVPASMSYAQLNGVRFLPLEEKHASIGIGVLYRREDTSPALLRFLKSVHRFPSDYFYRDNAIQHEHKHPAAMPLHLAV